MRINIFEFDIMLDGRFVCHMAMPVKNRKIDNDALKKYIETRRPSLRDKNYIIQ